MQLTSQDRTTAVGGRALGAPATIVDQARLILGDGAGFVELRGRRPQERTISKRGWYSRDQLADLERRIAGLPRHDVWIGAAPRRERNCGTAEDVLCAWSLWQDCDTAESVDALRRFSPMPSMVVRSSAHSPQGERLQAWWRLSEPLPPGQIKPALARLRAALGADSSCVDEAHVMRPVGGTNHKWRPGGEPVVCKWFSGEVHDIGTLLAACPLVLETAKPALGEQQARTERVPAGERHEYMKETVRRLLRGGFTDPDCIECLLRAEFDRICEPDPDQSPTYFADWAKWAGKSRIAQRENAVAEFAARWKGAA